MYRRTENPTATDKETELYCKQNLDPFMREVERCTMQNLFFWTMWAIVVLKESEETDHTLFHWELCRMRLQLYAKQKEWFSYHATLAAADDEIDEMDDLEEKE